MFAQALSSIQDAQLIDFNSAEYRCYMQGIFRRHHQLKLRTSCPFEQDFNRQLKQLEFACNRWLNEQTAPNPRNILKYVVKHRAYYQELDHVVIHEDASVSLCEIKIRHNAFIGCSKKGHAQLSKAAMRLSGFMQVKHRICLTFDLASILGLAPTMAAEDYHAAEMVKVLLDAATPEQQDVYLDLAKLLPYFIERAWLAADFIAELIANYRFIYQEQRDYQTQAVTTESPFAALASQFK